MSKISIIVKGPGGVINNELAIIEKALKDAGAEVTIENDCPEEGRVTPWRSSENVQVLLIAYHQPWGG